MSLHRALAFSAVLLSCSSNTVVQKGPGGTSSSSSGGPISEAQPTPESMWGAATKKIDIEIDYAAGAEPYTDAITKFGSPWQIMQTNMYALVDGKKDVSFPTTLDKMEKVDIEAKSYASADILAVAAAHRDHAASADTATFYVVFINGYYIDETGAENQDVLGVSIGTTGVIGMFKPAIAGTQKGQKTVVSQFVEQSTLVHEIGHAVGFVNNGVPAASAHQDTEHGNHCTNPKCVMYWQNEGAASAIAFVKQYVTSGSAVIYDQGCLGDARVLEDKLAHP